MTPGGEVTRHGRLAALLSLVLAGCVGQGDAPEAVFSCPGGRCDDLGDAEPEGCSTCTRGYYECAGDPQVEDVAECALRLDACHDELDLVGQCTPLADEPRQDACNHCRFEHTLCRLTRIADHEGCLERFRRCRDRVVPRIDVDCPEPRTCEECRDEWDSCVADPERSRAECGRSVQTCLDLGDFTSLDCPVPGYLCDRCQQLARLCHQVRGPLCEVTFDNCVSFNGLQDVCEMPEPE